MTEQEFRDALKKSVGHTGLSSERQIQVLARREREKKKRTMSNQMKIVVVTMMVLLLSVTGAVAAGLGGVDWNGNPAQPPELVPLEDAKNGNRMIEIMEQPGYGVIQCVVAPRQSIDENGVLNGLTVDFFSESLEEMEAWVKADGTLQWPSILPDGYTLKLGRVGYMCGTPGGLKEISNEKTEDGYMHIQYELSPENRFMNSYFLNMANEAGHELVIHVQMEIGNFLEYTFYAGEGSKVAKLNIMGASNALYIDSELQNKLALRRPLSEIKHAYYMDYLDVYIIGGPTERTQDFENVVTVINSTELTENDLLAIFGLTAQ